MLYLDFECFQLGLLSRKFRFTFYEVNFPKSNTLITLILQVQLI